jgi:serine/threonine protein kinase
MAVFPLNAVVGNKYRIEKRVGAGGMGEVYRATNLQTRMPVAVKVLTQMGESGTALARFRNEAVIQYNLRHPNVAALYEYFEYQGKPCIVMEFVEGRTLDEWIRESGALESARALEILADVCEAVSYMHSKGTIHRDIKSENIRVNAEGKAKLLDFGISVARSTPALTRVGYAIGTPENMAPEQHQGLRGDARSDVWALGVLLYEMVTGASPFANRNPVGLREDVLGVRYIPAAKRKPGLPKPVARMISTCLQLKPEERYASSGVMLREVQQLRRRLDGEKWKQALFSKPAAAAAGLTLLLALLFLYAVRLAHVSSRSSRGTPTEADGSPDHAPIRIPAETQPPHSNRAFSAPPTTSVSVPAQGESNSMPYPNAVDQKTVRIATYDGPAQVTDEDGKPLGRTPYPLAGPLGKSYELWLRRPGFRPRKVDVQINNNKSEYLFGLEKIEDNDFEKKE